MQKAGAGWRRKGKLMAYIKDKKQCIIFGTAAVVTLLFFYAFMYSDILITTSFGINFWDVLFSGDIFRFYEVCHSDVETAAYRIFNTPDYDFLIYIIFAVWNLPLWIARRAAHVNIWESTLAVAWAKTIVLLFTVLTIKAVFDLCKTLKMNENNRRDTVLLFATSSILYMSVFVTSQYDIVYLFLMLKAFDFYLKDDMWRFTAFMALAIPVKSLAVFLFPALLLYKEKNVVKICFHTVVLFLPWLLFKTVFPMGGENGGNVDNMLVIFGQKVVFRDLEMPLFILAVIIFYIACYVLKVPEDGQKAGQNSVWIAFLSYALFFVLCGTNPYWYILLLPFQCILIGLNEDRKFINAILETITSICYVGMYVWLIPWCFDVNLVRSTYVAKIFGLHENHTDNILEVLHTILPSVYEMAEDRAAAYLFMVFLAGNIVFIAVNFVRCGNTAFKNAEIPKYLYAIRYALGIGVCALPLIAYVF